MVLFCNLACVDMYIRCAMISLAAVRSRFHG